MIQSRIAQCGIEPGEEASPIATINSVELLDRAEDWEAACVAAHATYDNGVLKQLIGLPRARVWKHRSLYAAAIAGAADALPDPYRAIAANADAIHRRDRPVALLNAADISSSSDVSKAGATCMLKLSELSAGAVRQAFLDPDSRIKLDSDAEDVARPCVVAVHYEGGLLSEQTLQFSEQLSVLVGAPGAGKSTVIESLRAAFELEPTSPRALDDHRAIVSQVLGNQTTISVVVSYPEPAQDTYVVERTLPNPARVLRAETWEPSGVPVSELTPSLQVYGQHEIAELAEDAARRTQLIDRFMPRRPERDARIGEMRVELEHNRSVILAAIEAVDAIESQRSLLPGLEEKLQRYESAGIAELLALQTELDRENQSINEARSRLERLRNPVDGLIAALPLEAVVAGNHQLDESPFRDKLLALDSALAEVTRSAERAVRTIKNALDEGEESVDAVFAEWKERRGSVDDQVKAAESQLDGGTVSATAYRELRQRVDQLQGLGSQAELQRQTLREARTAREALLHEYETKVAERVRDYRTAASRASQGLSRVVRVSTLSLPDFAGIEVLLRRQGGRIAEALELLSTDEQLSTLDLARRLRAGEAALREKWSLSEAQAERLAETSETTLLELEELEPTIMTSVELNVSDDLETTRWQSLEELSKGQKATAILLLLFLDTDAPLVVDQPEDDLDNRFIADRVVPMVRQKKATRQFVFSTHNPNVPVLADAELIVGLSAIGAASGPGHAEVLPGHHGSIDSLSVKHLIEARLEGGRNAFLERQRKYGLK